MEFVFAICDFASPDGTHGFFHVEGHFDSAGNLVTNGPPRGRRQSTNRWSICVQNIGKGRYGMFKVLDDRPMSESTFNAVPIQSTLHQVLQVREARTEIDNVSAKMRTGMKLVPEVGARTSVFVLFSDGLLCGPIQMKSKDANGDFLVIEQQSWSNPVKAWNYRGRSNLQEFDTREHGKIAFTTAPDEQPDTYVDFAPPEFTLRRVLETMRGCDGAAAAFPPAKIRELSELLAKVPDSPQISPRIAALGNRLKGLEAATEDFPELLERCLSLPSVQETVEEKASLARDAAISAFEKEKAEVTQALTEQKNEVEQLKQAKQDLTEQKLKLESEIGQLNDAIESSKLKFNQAVADFAQEAQSDVVKFLAKISVLRPFLLPDSAGGEVRPSISLPIRSTTRPVQRSANDGETGVRQLADTLKKHGIGPRIAACVSAEIVAAVAVGQIIVFRGSLASVAATLVAESLFGDSFGSVDVPVGTRLQIDFPASGNSSATRGILVQGANRSCIDAYGGNLLETVRHRIAGLIPPTSPPFIILSLYEGPSALQPTPSMAELGPILHTDTWTWQPGASAVPRELGQLDISKVPQAKSEDPESLQAIRRLLVGLPGTFFAGQLKGLLAALTKYHHPFHASKNDAEDQALSSLINCWVIPYLFAVKADNQILEDCVQLVEEDEAISRHVELLRSAQEC